MQQITLGEARKLYLSHPARLVSQEQSTIYYDNFAEDAGVVPYLTCGCLAVYSGSEWHIHALSENADLFSAISRVKEKRKTDSENLFVFTWDHIPVGIEHCRGSYKFARAYAPYSDSDIRQLTENDLEAIRVCCAHDPEDDALGNGFAEGLRSLCADDLQDPQYTFLGIFADGSLRGIVSAEMHKELGIATIDIYVNRQSRKKGYAKRLLGALCGTDPDVMYCYSCTKANVASASTARACGFVFKGAYLLIE